MLKKFHRLLDNFVILYHNIKAKLCVALFVQICSELWGKQEFRRRLHRCMPYKWEVGGTKRKFV